MRAVSRNLSGANKGGSVAEDQEQTTEAESEKRLWYKQWWAIAGIAFILGIGVGAAPSESSQEGETIEASSKPATVDTSALTQEIEALKAERDEATTEAEETSDELSEAQDQLSKVQDELDSKNSAEAEAEAEKAKTTFTDGTYLVGTDIPAGRYKGTPTADSAYWQISSDANGSDIIENNNTAGDFYVQVSAGQFLEINWAEITLVE